MRDPARPARGPGEGGLPMVTARIAVSLLAVVVMAAVCGDVRPAAATSAKELNRDSVAALNKLYDRTPEAKNLGAKAKSILVFPTILKAGFMFGAQYGEGALLRQGKAVGYYNSVAASYGFQAGAQAFGYALFFMTDGAQSYLQKAEGFELGMGPSIVVVDTGMAKALTTATIQHDIYAFIFDQKGLMGGVGLQGSKISRIAK
jgi:lipid-binding SYLF domain-containing protein